MTTQVQTPAPEVAHAVPAGPGSVLVRLFRDNVAVHVALLTGFILFTFGEPVPEGNELVYLLAAYRRWHPDFLLNDWTYSGDFTTHLVFNTVAGALTLLVSPEALGWIGRLICWPLLMLGLIRIGRRFEIPLPVVSLAIVLWLGIVGDGALVVGGEWIVRGFEAKVVAYVLLFFAIDRFLEEKDIVASILLGLTISFHAAVGVSGALAIGVALIALRYPWRRIARVVGWSAVFSLPGMIPVLLMEGSGSGATNGMWRFLTVVYMPHHLDPFSFVRRDVLVLLILLAFAGLCLLRYRTNRFFRFMMAFQGGLAAVFAFGVACRWLGRYTLLQITPFRVFPILAPLFFLFAWLAVLMRRGERPAWLLGLVGTLALLGLRDPVGAFRDHIQWRSAVPDPERQDLDAALRWLAEQTPNGSVAILPPWAKEGFYVSQRAEIANWYFPPYERLEEWRERIEALAGPLEVEGIEAYNAFEREALMRDAVERNYHERTQAQIAAIVERYGGDYLVSDASYSYPVLFDTGTYKVYRLTPSEAAPPPATGRSRPGS
ncbi:MAG TPA: hypothetical protein VF188_05550 [Longimicrobiales bacterium]